MANRGGITDVIKGIGEVPKSFDRSEGFLRPLTNPLNVQPISFDDAVDMACKMVGDALKSRDKKRSGEVDMGVNMIGSLAYVFFGGDQYLEAQRRPTHFEMLPAAASAYLAHATAVQALVPSVAVAVDQSELSELYEHLMAVIKVRADQTALNEGYDRLQATLETKLHGMLTRVYALASSAVLSNMTLNVKLEAFIRLFTQASLDAKETKKENEKVVDKTVEAVKKVLEKAQKAPAAPAPPPPPAPELPDLDALKSRGKTRGKGRI